MLMLVPKAVEVGMLNTSTPKRDENNKGCRGINTKPKISQLCLGYESPEKPVDFPLHKVKQN